MPFPRPRTLPCPSLNYAPRISSRPIATCNMIGTHFQRASMQTKFQILPRKIASQACVSTRSFPKEHFNGMLQLVMDEESCKFSHLQMTIEPSLEQRRSEKLPAGKTEEHISHDLEESLQDKFDIATNSAKGRVNICDREMERRRKIGLANTGRTPWNKGRKHSQETRERIKKRTIEAMRDPKVRKKMFERPRSHSDLSKARIGASLRRIWSERLKHKISQEKCYLIWARSISEAAKAGGLNQRALSWDSYEKEKSDIMLQYLQWKSEKARVKEIAKLRAEIREKVRAEKLESLAQEKKEREEKAKARKIEALARKKLKDEKRKMALYEGLKLKARLSKKQLEGLIKRKRAIQPQPVIDKWDIDCIKIDNMRRRVSLADQIRAVKTKKAKTAVRKVFETGQYDSSVE